MNAVDKAVMLEQARKPEGKPAFGQADLVSDVLDALTMVLARDGIRVMPLQRHAAEARVRASWGGTRAYIGKSRAEREEAQQIRNLRIWQAWSSGEPVAQLAKRHDLTARRIKQIISQIEQMKPNCLTHFHARR